MVQIYTDGSYKGHTVGTGVRVEMGKGFEAGRQILCDPKKDSNLHEFFAFIDGAIFAKQLGLSVAECTFVTDCEQIVYGAQGNKVYENETSHLRVALFKNLRKARKYYNRRVFNDALVYLASDFRWVRGHQHCVGNRRADHIAGHARKLRDPMPYDKWIQQGYSLGPMADVAHGRHFMRPFTNPTILEQKRAKIDQQTVAIYPLSV